MEQQLGHMPSMLLTRLKSSVSHDPPQNHQVQSWEAPDHYQDVAQHLQTGMELSGTSGHERHHIFGPFSRVKSPSGQEMLVSLWSS